MSEVIVYGIVLIVIMIAWPFIDAFCMVLASKLGVEYDPLFPFRKD